MKKALLLFLLLELTKTQAQELRDQQMSKWSLGVRAGMSLLPDFEDQLQKNYKLGINAGINTSYKLNKYLSFKTEVNYTQKGKSYSFQDKERKQWIDSLKRCRVSPEECSKIFE